MFCVLTHPAKVSSFKRRLNPIWTIETGSAFILQVTAEELFENAEGIDFRIMDYDALVSNNCLGFASVPPEALYEGNGERQEFDIKPMHGSRIGQVSRKDRMSYPLFESDVMLYSRRESWPYIAVTPPRATSDSWKRTKKRKRKK